jgi:hypothetical protein
MEIGGLFKSNLRGFINWPAFTNLKAGLEQSPNCRWRYFKTQLV